VQFLGSNFSRRVRVTESLSLDFGFRDNNRLLRQNESHKAEPRRGAMEGLQTG
jgi:hypothetical protein